MIRFNKMIFNTNDPIDNIPLTEETLKDIVNRFNEIESEAGFIYGSLDYNYSFLSLIDIAFMCNNVTLKNGEIYADIQILDTKKGEILQKLIDDIVFRPNFRSKEKEIKSINCIAAIHKN